MTLDSKLVLVLLLLSVDCRSIGMPLHFLEISHDLEKYIPGLGRNWNESEWVEDLEFESSFFNIYRLGGWEKTLEKTPKVLYYRIFFSLPPKKCL